MAFSANSADSAVSVFLPIIREWAAGTETGDRAELEDLPEDLPFWSEVSATAETCLGTECPRYDDCFVTRMRQRAAAVGHRHRQSSPAVRGCGRPAKRVRRGDSRVRQRDRRRGAPARGRGHAVLRLRRQQLPRGRSGRGRRTVAWRPSPTSRRPSTASGNGRGISSPNWPMRHRGEGRGKAEERVRASESSLSATADTAAHLTGALDILESTLALADAGAHPADDAPRTLKAPRTGARRSPRWCAAPANSVTTCGACSARATPTTCTSSRCAAAASSCAPRRWMCRRSFARFCSIACGRSC